MTPAIRLLLAELRVARPSALRRLRAALRAHKGSITGAAQTLGIAVSTLWDVAYATPKVRGVLTELGMGRTGAAWCATKARRNRPAGKSDAGPRKSS